MAAFDWNLINSSPMWDSHSRRSFLGWLAASPLLQAQQLDDIITDPKQAINVMDFEPAARKILPPAHYGYMMTGVEDDSTLKANRDGFNRLYLRPRRLVDISKIDTRTEIFGTRWDMPIGLSPIGNTRAFHADGELAVARAANVKKSLQVVSTNATCSFEDVSEALGRPAWYQLYPTSRWEVAERLVKRVEAAGCPVVAVTIDSQAGRRTETFERWRRLDKRDCTVCHGSERGSFYKRKPMFQGIDTQGLGGNLASMTWDHLRQLRKFTSMKLVVKGVETAEDAKLCVEAGMDGVLVSNHGGRASETNRGTIDCLPEIVEAAGGRVPVFLDGGIRRGSDAFKALALGARAVFIGRPYLWGVAAFGQPGVERVIDLLHLELELVMKQCGVRSMVEMRSSYVGQRQV